MRREFVQREKEKVPTTKEGSCSEKRVCTEGRKFVKTEESSCGGTRVRAVRRGFVQ